jgi:hypothetical protein
MKYKLKDWKPHKDPNTAVVEKLIALYHQ